MRVFFLMIFSIAWASSANAQVDQTFQRILDRTFPGFFALPFAREVSASSPLVGTVFDGVLPRNIGRRTGHFSDCGIDQSQYIRRPPEGGLQSLRFIDRGGSSAGLGIQLLETLGLSGDLNRNHVIEITTGRVHRESITDLAALERHFREHARILSIGCPQLYSRIQRAFQNQQPLNPRARQPLGFFVVEEAIFVESLTIRVYTVDTAGARVNVTSDFGAGNLETQAQLGVNRRVSEEIVFDLPIYIGFRNLTPLERYVGIIPEDVSSQPTYVVTIVGLPRFGRAYRTPPHPAEFQGAQVPLRGLGDLIFSGIIEDLSAVQFPAFGIP